jgi:thiol-disulfide isomerase/thioredoxin
MKHMYLLLFSLMLLAAGAQGQTAIQASFDNGLRSSQQPVWAGQPSYIALELQNTGHQRIESVTPVLYLEDALVLLDPVSVDLAAEGRTVITLALYIDAPGVYAAYAGVTTDPQALLASGFSGARTDMLPEGTDLLPVDLVALSADEAQLGVFVEQGTGTWCGWCPRGHVKVDELLEKYDNVSAVAIHWNDPMAIPVYSAFINSSIGGFPGGHVQRRFMGLNPTAFEVNYLEALKFAPHANLSIDFNYDEDTRELEAIVSAEMLVQCVSCRLNLMLTEDGVTGSGSGWAQSNFYAGGGAGPMGGYENLPNPVPASMMVYNQVARRAVGTPTGVANSLPLVAKVGETYSFSFTTTLDEGWNPENINLIGLFHAGNNVSNATNTSMSSSSSLALPERIDRLEVFPNPSAGEAWVRMDLPVAGQVAIEVINLLGQPVYRQDFGQQVGDLMYRLPAENWTPGLYQLLIRVDGQAVTRPLMLSGR